MMARSGGGFCTVVNCMDGRVQLPVIHYLMQRLDVSYVDSITEAGPVAVLSGGSRDGRLRSILDRITLSIERHGSKAIVVVAHHDCAGNPVSKDTQIGQIKKAISALRKSFPGKEVMGLWVDEDWKVVEI